MRDNKYENKNKNNIYLPLKNLQGSCEKNTHYYN